MSLTPLIRESLARTPHHPRDTARTHPARSGDHWRATGAPTGARPSTAPAIPLEHTPRKAVIIAGRQVPAKGAAAVHDPLE